jgi:DNA ligase-1
MMIVDLIRALNATASRNEKMVLLHKAFEDDLFDFFTGAQLANDPLVTFGVAKAALIEEDDGHPGTFSFDDFLTLCKKLSSRSLTGHAARDAINDAAQHCQFDMWNLFYRRILLKDLKIGIETKTINKVLDSIGKTNPDALSYKIPVFGLQLAFDGSDPSHTSKVKGKKLIDLKLDGIRLLSFLDKEAGTVRQMTRGGNENTNFDGIRSSLLSLMAELPVSIVLDGEMVGASFSDLMTQVNRKESVDTANLKLALFDILPMADYRAGICRIPQDKRHVALTDLQLSGLLKKHCGNNVYVNPKIEIDLDTVEGQSSFEEFNRNAISAGFEGIMIKEPTAPYELKKGANWLKKKPTISVSLEIYDFAIGEPETKNANTLGALQCRGTDDGKYIEVSVGSGLSQEDRDMIWNNKEKYRGYIVEVTADALSQNRDNDKVWSLRFPRFKGFRGTKPGEKI